MRRVNEAIRQVIGDAVSCDLKDPRVGFVTVTDVRTNADLSHARVYVSVLGEPDARAETMDGLRSAHGYLQRRIAGELHLKRTPTLDFSYDDTTDRAMRLDALLDAEIGTRQDSSAREDQLTAGDEPGEESTRA
ncbi:MAG TPA: 30S ribosome-binding factor RbfA [Solirubrobacteraceae bacterium]|nr:30S ribosome-binding factor RbfA [Solirubrobacteraceae bacterium]